MHIRHVGITMNIAPSTSDIHVQACLEIDGIDDDTLGLRLNPGLEVLSVQAELNEDLVSIDYNESRPNEQLFVIGSYWELSMPDGLKKKSKLVLHIEYQGRIFRHQYSTTRICSEYVELACYALWYPLISFDDRPSFKVTIHAPDDWVWIMNATKTSESPLIWESGSARTDLTLLGRPKSNAITTSQSELFWGEPRNLTKFKILEDGFSKFSDLLKRWLGPSECEELRFALIPRETGGAYSRCGLIVLPDSISDSITEEKLPLYLRYWTHEFSHSWFNRASVSDYHNWVDEALAEYTSFLALEEIYGPESFAEQIEKTKSRIMEEEDLPSIRSLKRDDPRSQIVYYLYGALVLHEIRGKIGREAFLAVLREFARISLEKEKVVTDDLAASLKSVTGDDWAQYLNERLDMKPLDFLAM